MPLKALFEPFERNPQPEPSRDWGSENKAVPFLGHWPDSRVAGASFGHQGPLVSRDPEQAGPRGYVVIL